MRLLLFKLLTLIFAAFCGVFCRAEDTVSIIFVGDVMQHKTQINAVYQNGTYNYEPCFRLIKNEISSADLAVANLEAPLAGVPYSGFPQFSAPDDIALALDSAGFDVLLTANNHALDRRTVGALRTIAMLDSFRIKHTGMFRNSAERAERYPLLFDVKNVKFAMLNYSYGTNGIPFEKPFIINLIDTASIISDIAAAKLLNPDCIIAFMHWGEEYQRYPSREQKFLTDLMFAHGVNLVIGAHPHVIQPMEKRYSANGRCEHLVAYSLGNLVSNQPFVNTDGGAMLKLTIVKDSVGVRVQWAGYSLVWVYKPKENGRIRHYILPVAAYENDTELLSPEFRKQIKTFTNNARKLLDRENIGIGEYRIREQ